MALLPRPRTVFNVLSRRVSKPVCLPRREGVHVDLGLHVGFKGWAFGPPKGNGGGGLRLWPPPPTPSTDLWSRRLAWMARCPRPLEAMVTG
eukprot:scaffold2200_cov413-Prasinococcus_capsulatus_cf.AAC.18